MLGNMPNIAKSQSKTEEIWDNYEIDNLYYFKTITKFRQNYSQFIYITKNWVIGRSLTQNNNFVMELS